MRIATGYIGHETISVPGATGWLGRAVRSPWLLLAPVLLFACGDEHTNPAGPDPPSFGDGEVLYRGVTLDISGRVTDATLDELAAAGVNWIALIPFGWQSRFDNPAIRLRTSGVRWSETDEGLRQISAQAHARGIGVLLKPHIWLTAAVVGEWRGTIRFDTEEEWQQWEDDYRALILHYAQLAAELEVELFSVGVELHSAVRERPEFWRELIAEVRSVFPGTITYGANWFEEYDDVGFWDLLDTIGVHAYFPLTDQLDATIDQLEQGWQPHVRELEALAARHQRPIVFLEVGYRSIAGAAMEPWNFDVVQPQNATEQSESYEALFRTFWSKPWFEGLFVWKWNVGVRDRDSYSPQGKAAERVLSEWYLRDRDGA